MLLDVTTLKGLCLYTLYLLHRLRFFRWRDVRRVVALYQKITTATLGAPWKEMTLESDDDGENVTDIIQRSQRFNSQENGEEEYENEFDMAMSLLNETQRVASINDKLQPEVLSLVFDQLAERPRTLRRCMLVCRSWYELLGPIVWRAPRVLWSKHWSRFHPVSFTTSAAAKPNVEGAISELKLRQVSRNDLLRAISLNLIHESDKQELTQWFEWRMREKARRFNALKRRRRLAVERTRQSENRQLDGSDEEDNEDENDDNDSDSDESDDESDNNDDSEDVLNDMEDLNEDAESDTEYDASDDETPLMKLVSGIDYLQSLLSPTSRDSQQLHGSVQSTEPILSNPFSSTVARARRHQAAREVRQRLAQIQPFDGLPASLPLQTCGHWIQAINLQQETPYPQRINPQANMNSAPPAPQLHPLEHEEVQAPFQHHNHQQHRPRPPHRQGLLASFIDALTHNHFDDDDQFGDIVTRRSQPPVHLRSRREFVTDKTLQTILENCPRLCRLTISECHGITDEGFKLIRDSKCVAQSTLISLHMAGCYQITDKGLLNLAGESEDIQLQPRFESLDLAGCYRITDQGLIPLLRQCGNRLIQLRVHDCIDVTSESVLALAEHCPRIRWLDLGRSGKMTEAGLVHLASRCFELEWLSLARHHPNDRRDSGIQLDEGFEEEEQEVQEEEEEPDLTESSNPEEEKEEEAVEEQEEKLITDHAISLICESCPKLHLLDLSYIPTITNNAIESLSGTARSLVYLAIIGCPGITSQSLYYLAKLRNTSEKLGCITMGDAQGISEREIEQIMQGTLSGWQKSMVDETILGNVLGRNWN
ncbi:hypothetical protein BGX26_002853 [Mortierella sp. AD094]|nr:hypothetical protein BGX26_002853 [Mortierella sp. AD094]